LRQGEGEDGKKKKKKRIKNLKIYISKFEKKNIKKLLC